MGIVKLIILISLVIMVLCTSSQNMFVSIDADTPYFTENNFLSMYDNCKDLKCVYSVTDTKFVFILRADSQLGFIFNDPVYSLFL